MREAQQMKMQNDYDDDHRLVGQHDVRAMRDKFREEVLSSMAKLL